MDSKHFIELHDGLEAFYPLGVSALGAATGIVLTSPEAKRAARRTARWIFYLGWACVVVVIASIRLLGAGLIAVPADLVVLALHNLLAIRRAKQHGRSLPPNLARKLCADAMGHQVKEEIPRAWGILVMCVVMIVPFALGNLPAFWTLGVSSFIFAVHNLIASYRLAGSALTSR